MIGMVQKTEGKDRLWGKMLGLGLLGELAGAISRLEECNQNYGSDQCTSEDERALVEARQLVFDVMRKIQRGSMTAPVLAPPAILKDLSGQTWVFSGMTDLGPAYMPQQAPMPLPEARSSVAQSDNVGCSVWSFFDEQNKGEGE